MNIGILNRIISNNLLYDVQHCEKYITYAETIFERDGFACRICGKITMYLVLFRKKTAQLIFEKNGIVSFEEAINCKELWDLDNGVTLCRSCRKKIEGR